MSAGDAYLLPGPSPFLVAEGHEPSGPEPRASVAVMEAPGMEALPFEGQASGVRTQLTVSVRTDFAAPTPGRGLAFHWTGQAVRSAQVAIVGTPVAALTNAQGVATLDLATVPDGVHSLRVKHSNSSQSTTLPAGPDVADDLLDASANFPKLPSRIYRELTVAITVRSSRLVAASIAAGTTHAVIGNRTRRTFSSGHLPIDWRPVWMGSPLKCAEEMRDPRVIDLIVVHHTAGARIGGAINHFLNKQAEPNAHYVINVDGHIVKVAEDRRRANHAGHSFWRGRTAVNGFSIGIEVVHATGPFKPAQMASLIALLGRLRAAFPTIPSNRIVGHGDIATANDKCDTKLLGRKAIDPGREFDWPALEAAGLGMIPRPIPGIAGAFAGVFTGSVVPAVVLEENDRDPTAGQPALLGGIIRPGFTGGPIRELQNDLEHIGYAARPRRGGAGIFTAHTTQAVSMFQRHFFAGARRAGLVAQMGRVDLATALMIKSVRAGLP